VGGYFKNANFKESDVMEILVPVGIFVLGIIISLLTGSLGVQRIVEGRALHGEDQLGRTAAYIAPFKDDKHDFPESQKRKM
jgi:hypothetical protein